VFQFAGDELVYIALFVHAVKFLGELFLAEVGYGIAIVIALVSSRL
jgi:hypothetical protein